jgi:hypothetical protein
MSNRITKKGIPQSPGDYGTLKRDVVMDAPMTAAAYTHRIEDLPVDTPSLMNRDTKLSSLKRNLKNRGGFDGNLWQPPRVGRVRSSGATYIFDGDHSRHLFMHTYPEAKTMPMCVIDVDAKKDIHRLFYQVNKTCKTAISQEEVFVHQVHADDNTVSKYANACYETGMFVYGSHEEGATVGDPAGVMIKFSQLKAAYHASENIDMLRDAKNLIMKCKTPLAANKYLPGGLLRSLCLLFSAYPDLRAGGECGEEFEEFFVDSVGAKTPERYGKRVEQDCRSGYEKSYRMAAGIAQEINDHQKDQPGTFAAVSKGATKRIYLNDLKRLCAERKKKAGRKKAQEEQ